MGWLGRLWASPVHLVYDPAERCVGEVRAVQRMPLADRWGREALQAVQFAIDELKKSVPIWKKEVYAGEHGAKWKENVESAAPTIGDLQYPDGGKAPTRSEYLQMAANGSAISRRGGETLVLVASLAVVLGAVAYARKR